MTQLAPVKDIETATDRLVLRVKPGFKRDVARASDVRDGGNVSRLIFRAINRLIEEERLLETDQKEAA